MKHTPWRIEFEPSGYATVYDSENNIVSLLTDLELGWTDTQTGNYHSPDADADHLKRIVKACNAHYELLEALEEITGIIEELEPRYNNADRISDIESIARAAIEKYT